MQTRKSSPLPNPNDTIHKYRIDYQIHYQNFQKYLQERIEKQTHERNLLIKQFTRLAKVLQRKDEETQDNDVKVNKEQGIRDEMGKVYEKICNKELEIHKLYEEKEGVIMQLCNLLKEKRKYIDRYKQIEKTSYRPSQVTFLHLESFPFHDDEQADITKTMSRQQEDIQSSLEINKVQSNKHHYFGGNTLLNELVVNNLLQSKTKNQNSQNVLNSIQITHKNNEMIQLEQQVGVSSKTESQEQTSYSNIQTQNVPPVQQLKLSVQIEQQAKTQQQIMNVQDQKIESIIIKYKKTQQKKEIYPTQNSNKKCIEISSSFDDQLCKKDQNMINPQLKSTKFQDASKSNRFKQKKNLKSCITILD